MDLLSLTFRSLHLGTSTTQPEDFLQLENQNANTNASSMIEDTGKQVRRRSKQNIKEEVARSSSKLEVEELRTINLDEVAWHDTADNCWIIVHDFVYDCTDFLRNHPGGSDLILEYAGRDATLAFIGTGHSSMARQSLERYLIGELPQKERIFRVPNGVKVSGF